MIFTYIITIAVVAAAFFSFSCYVILRKFVRMLHHFLDFMDHMIDMKKEQVEKTAKVDWICGECGDKYGRRECGVATWHIDRCNICNKLVECTEPRDFGGLRDGWTNDL